MQEITNLNLGYTLAIVRDLTYFLQAILPVNRLRVVISIPLEIRSCCTQLNTTFTQQLAYRREIHEYTVHACWIGVRIVSFCQLP
jgi:hypothetical protein